MGWYINHDKDGNVLPTTGKADALLNSGTVEKEWNPKSDALEDLDGKGVICVLSNYVFDAALFCYDEDELQLTFRHEEHRPRRWLIMDRTLAEKLSGYDQTYKARG